MKTTPIRKALLCYYDREKRDLPWRHRPTPYTVLVSELMLQQTQVATVIPYFARFLRQFPDLQTLAAAPEEQVMKAWAGLGYYSRARNLQRAAREVVARHGGKLPADPDVLQELPGLGPYTSAAVAAIAFGVPVFPLDGNGLRVLARLSGDEGRIDEPKTRDRLRALGQSLVPKERPGDFAQAVMDLGATVCVPQRPRCGECPVRKNCVAFSSGRVDDLPRRSPRRAKRALSLVCVAAERDGKILLVRRAEKTLLGGTWTLPFVEEMAGSEQVAAALAGSGIRITRAESVRARVRHVFTHLDVEARLVRGRALGRVLAGTDFVFADPGERAESSFTKKLLVAWKREFG